ncbi:MAG: sigma-70 family RNA polymerase sigma factor [Granulosicoccus sp.]
MQEKLDQYLKDIADGEEKALTLLFEAVSSRLFGLQLRILKNQELAEDALQETFLKVWKSAKTYKAGHGSPMTWLNSLARNQALDMLRRAGTRADVNVRIPELNPDDWRNCVPEYSDLAEEYEGLLHCLEGLNSDTRACIVGLYCDGYTQEEMSQSLERPLGTVKSWVRRGLLSLRECLDNER